MNRPRKALVARPPALVPERRQLGWVSVGRERWESQLPREAVLAFLSNLADALDSFVSGMERYLASGVQPSRRHSELALEHGIAMHRASLGWARSALAALGGPAGE